MSPRTTTYFSMNARFRRASCSAGTNPSAPQRMPTSSENRIVSMEWILLCRRGSSMSPKASRTTPRRDGDDGADFIGPKDHICRLHAIALGAALRVRGGRAEVDGLRVMEHERAHARFGI